MTTGRVLCVDDDEQIRRLITRVLVDAGHECVPAASVDEARVLLDRESFAAVLCDINLPGVSGFDLLRELRENYPSIAPVMVTGRDDPRVANRALDLGAFGYITKPFAPNELLIDLANALHRQRSEAAQRAEAETAVQNAHLGTLRRLSRTVEFHDGETGAHIERVGAHAVRIGLGLGLPAPEVELLRLAAPLHDIGKVGVPATLLRKPGPLSRAERVTMQQHADIGRELLGGSGNHMLELAATIAWTHHERWDGGGYPRSLAAKDIPLAGRIVAVADVFDAITSDRPYRAARTVEEAFSTIAAERAGAFDPDVVDAFLA